MKVLFLTDEFYPNFGANSLVVKNIALEMIKNGIAVYVMPFCYDEKLPKEDEYKGISIVRIVTSDNHAAMMSGLKKGQLITCGKAFFHYLKSKLTKNRSLFSKDRIFAKQTLLRFIDENNIDAVISINCSIELGFPMYHLKKNKMVDCKWIMYMLDPFESHEYYREHYSFKELRRIQHNMMSVADAVVATKIIKSEICEWESEDIINKITTAEFPKIERTPIEMCDDNILLNKEKINVVCTGSKNEKVRNSDYTLTLCEKLPDVLFHFVGIGWAEKQYAFRPNVIFYPPHSWNAIRHLQHEADYLLNIGNAVTNQLPSKVLEYISMGKPVINICKSKQCLTLEMLKKYDSINIFESDSLEDSAAVLNAFLKKKHTDVPFEIIYEQYKEFTPIFVEKQFENLLRG